MRAFMTTGTTHFLKNIIKKHNDKNFYLMKSSSATLVYYEDKMKKSIFVSGRAYDIVHDIGEMNPKGIVVMDHIPVSEEELPVFEQKTKRQLDTLSEAPGVLAAKLLKEDKANTFVILTQWRTENDLQKWKKTATTHELNFTKAAKLPAYFMDRPFTNQYYMLKEDEE